MSRSDVQELHLELLVGHRLVDASGKVIGHIEEVIAEREGDHLVVTEVHVGRGALAERLSVGAIGGAFTSLFGARTRSPRPRRIPIEAIDFSDPDHPRLRE